MRGHLSIPQFSAATGRPVSEVKRLILDGDLPFVSGPFLCRDQDGAPMYRHRIPEAEVERFAVPAEPSVANDPLARSEAARESAAARRREQIALEAGDPEAIKADARRQLAELTEKQRQLRATIQQKVRR